MFTATLVGALVATAFNVFVLCPLLWWATRP